jgi:hypothetical protein
MTADEIAAALDGARRFGRWWRCICPVHGSRTRRSLTLALRDHPRGLAVHCHAGSNRNDIIAELRRRGLIGGSDNARPAAGLCQDDDAARRVVLALLIWDCAQDARGTP